MNFNRKGFTLIELIIVVIIIGILAAIAAPMMQGNVLRARRSEAVAALGAIRTAERLYFAENQAYCNVANFGGANLLSGYIGTTDLAGPNYSVANYTVTGGGGAQFTAQTTAGVTGAGIVTMNQDGVMTGN